MIGLPIAIILANRWKRNAGWWLLAVVACFVVVGNIIEQSIGRA